MTSLRVLRWHIMQRTKNVLGIISCLVLALIAMFLDDLYDIWDDVRDDWRKTAVCTAIALLIWIIGFAELEGGQHIAAYFHLLLGMIPGLPFIRLLFVSYGQAASEGTRWHYLDKGW